MKDEADNLTTLNKKIEAKQKKITFNVTFILSPPHNLDQEKRPLMPKLSFLES